MNTIGNDLVISENRKTTCKKEHNGLISGNEVEKLRIYAIVMYLLVFSG
jgi:hypothetical protein